MTSGRELVEPPGYAVVTFVSTAMIVAGIGLAWTGLLLAAAGIVLSVIEFKELRRHNAWLLPPNAEDSPLLAKEPRRIGWVSLGTTLAGAAAALGAYAVSGNPLAVLPPAVLAGTTSVVLNGQLRRALLAGPKPPTE
ncbi:MAG: hypothetical protein JHD16_19030 [Solirubrobacteraceae bacterium]|nr:hypothetical protein [Solirubrobacteraceae bacterium]